MDYSLPEKFFLAPMAEITTPALRRIVKEFTNNVVMYSEMISAGAVAAGSAFNEPLISKYDFDDPYIYQILGNSEDVMSEACKILSEIGCYSIDINMGCSAPDILKKGFGAMLLKDIALVKKLVKACRKATSTRLSVKMRTGFYENNEADLIKFVKTLEDEGVDFISVHPRFAKLGFKRMADWRLIKLINENIKIPVIGNGDITDPNTAVRNMADFSCSGIMIGREAVKSPWIFKQCNDLLMKDGLHSFTVNIHEIFINVLQYIEFYLPPHLHKSRSHRFCQYFSKNLKFSHDIFSKIRNVDSIHRMIDIINDYFSRNIDEVNKTIKYS